MPKSTCATLLVASLLIVSQTLKAQVYRWQTLTNEDEITSLQFYSGYVWATTTGGVLRINPANDSVKSYINSDGLGSLRVSFSTYAGEGTTYFGSADGILSRFDVDAEEFSNTRFTGRDGANLKLFNADTSAGFLWIASSIGIIKYDRFRHGGEVKEIYRTLGAFAAELPIYDVAFFAGGIYAAASGGIAYADVDNPYLLDPNEWSNISIYTHPPAADTVLRFGVLDDRLYAGSNNGLSVIGADHVPQPLSDFVDKKIHDLTPGLGGLLVIASEGSERKLYVVTDDSAQVVPTEGVPTTSLNTVVDDERLFLGTAGKGIYREGEGVTAYVRLPIPGPASNDLVGGGRSADGKLYAVSRFGNVSLKNGDEWQQIELGNGERFSSWLDRQGSLWVGTFGEGAYRVRPDGVVEAYSSTNAPFGSVGGIPGFTLVNDFYEDPSGNIWFSSPQGTPLRTLLVFSPADSNWAYYDESDGLKGDKSEAVAAGIGMAALGVSDQGVAVLRYGASPFDEEGDTLKYFDRTRRLPSNTVNALAFDRDNRLWVGTNLGLAYFDPDIDFFYSEPLPDGVSSDVRAITTDSRNNLWVGTARGLAFISDGQAQKLAFTTENSEIVSDEIRSVYFDESSGQLLVFTAGGLSILDYGLSAPDSTAKVYAYPNPFVIKAGVSALLQFKINQRADVRIYTASGELVRQTDVNAGWDGRNDGGEAVASGVYIYHVVTRDPERHYTGKVFVLRR